MPSNAEILHSMPCFSYTVCMHSKIHSTPTIGPDVREEPAWELVRVVVMRDDGLRPPNFKEVSPTDDNTYVGRCRYHRADGGPY